MTTLQIRRPLLIVAAAVAVLSLVAVGTVMAMAFNNVVAPVWVTSTALYGLPLAFLLMLFLVIDGVAARRRTRGPGER
ncbi:hypothetical protein E5206_18830 [Arthrobacter sp. PAMC25564]|uniref:hypothetical protein n=1 Tax=Arthrobacter sp. PAMC25564 TaxID=2565366 RepID=UPI0010A21613|nr:hypothetical protein [Arthrobacter sp. PAMC25564]QCB98709.1 hypothetical protein E5206_18830 [Arthrobacter sp. PAMC25564]